VRAWFDSLGTRERMILAAGLALLIPLLVWALLWQPLAGSVDRLEEEVAQQRETLAWMQRAAAEVKRLRGSGGTAAAGLGGRSLLAVVDQSARAAGLGGGVKRIEPESADAVRVTLEGVAFDTVLTWLDALGRDFGVAAGMVSVEREPVPGQVRMRLTLHAPTS
jgi:general secretion pathway protein M